ncbi:MAG: mechanosensitive ion channel [Vicingaceae bacterium]
MEYQINEMQQMLHNELPGYGNVIWTIIVGLLFGITFGLMKRLLLPALGQGRKAQSWKWRLDVIERLYLPALGLAIMVSILVSRPLVGVVVSTITVLILYQPIKNYLLGVLFRAGKTYSIGQRVTVRNHQGSIRSFNSLSLEMELEDGSILDIPYHIFSNAIVLRSSPKSGVLSHSIELAISKPCDIGQVKQSIHTYLLSVPYVLPNQKISIEHLSDDEHRYLIKVIIHGIDKQQMYLVEGRLKAIFAKGEIKKVG